MQADLAERFWSKVHKTDGCWEWTGAKDPNGQGRINIRGIMRQAHRITFEMMHGPLKKNKKIIQICRNRSCVRPDHLALPEWNIRKVCRHCHYPKRYILLNGLCENCQRRQTKTGFLPPRKMTFETCRRCKRPLHQGVWRARGRCTTCDNYWRRTGQERPQHLITKAAPHGWCDCGKPAVTVQTFTFGRQKETFRLCGECAG